MQIRTQLTIRFVAITASILLLALMFIYFQFQRQLQDEFYNTLRSKALLTAEMIVGNNPPADFQLSPQPDPPFQPYRENISIYDRDHDRVYSHVPTARPVSAATLREILIMNECKFNHQQLKALGQVYINPKGRTFLVVAESEFDPQYLRELAQILVFVFCISVVVVSVGGWYFSGQALRPVSRIMNQVDSILPSDLSQRLEISNQHDELSRLVVTFNHLLDRIQQAFKTQKLFLSNVSHELKNPLTVIISQIEIALGKVRTNDEYRGTLASVLDDMKELNAVSSKLMQLAQLNTDGASIKFQRLRVDELVWQVKTTLLKSNSTYRVNFEVLNLPENEDLLYTSGNEHLLKTAILNLMDNGCKFSPDQQVRVQLSTHTDGAITVIFRDNGPGIPEKDLPLVFEPFYRSDRTSSIKGSGIGLSLAQSITKLHHIDLRVEKDGSRGTIFIMKFPPSRESPV